MSVRRSKHTSKQASTTRHGTTQQWTAAQHSKTNQQCSECNILYCLLQHCSSMPKRRVAHSIHIQHFGSIAIAPKILHFNHLHLTLTKPSNKSHLFIDWYIISTYPIHRKNPHLSRRAIATIQPIRQWLKQWRVRLAIGFATMKTPWNGFRFSQPWKKCVLTGQWHQSAEFYDNF